MCELDYKESWAPKNWCFWTVVLEKALRVPWTARRSNQSILKKSVLNIHWKDWCWSWIQLQYTGHLMRRTDSFEDTPMLGKIKTGGKGDDREWDGWMVSPTQWTWIWASSRRWWRTEKPWVLQSKEPWRVRHDLMIEKQQLFFPTFIFYYRNIFWTFIVTLHS